MKPQLAGCPATQAAAAYQNKDTRLLRLHCSALFSSKKCFLKLWTGVGCDKSSSLVLTEQLQRGTTGSAVGLNVSNVGVNM